MQAPQEAPAQTVEATNALEEIIRRRVRDAAFDDVVRKRRLEAEDDPTLKRQLPELSQERSKLGLGDVYAK